MTAPVDSIPLRRLVYALLISLAAGTVAGRILAVARVYEPYLFKAQRSFTHDPRGPWPLERPEPMATLGDNDRSRWDTIRALVDNGTYAIGYRDTNPKTGRYQDTGIIAEDGWKTIDKVLRPREPGMRQEFYSSKPPFLPTLLAGEYWLLKRELGWSITKDSWWVVRTILLTVNWLPLVIYLVVLACLVERYGTTDWGRLYVLAAGCLGTYMTPFSITLNNHTIAGWSALFALYPVLRIWDRGRQKGEGERQKAEGSSAAMDNPVRRSVRAGAISFAVAGFFAAFAACCELPAASFATAVFVLLLWLAPWRTLAFFVPAAAIPVATFLVTNYQAIGELKPAYSKLGTAWYEYEGSHWKPQPGQKMQGIDWADEPKSVYAFHLLLGHHGFFSLTPIFLMASAGIVVGLILRPRTPAVINQQAHPPRGLPIQDSGLRGVVALTLILSVVVIGWYIINTHNYGGWTSGPRWLIWLTPLWLLSLLPVADWLSSRRWGRGLAYLLLAVSVLSVNYPPWNPWRHPWLYDWMESFHLVHY